MFTGNLDLFQAIKWIVTNIVGLFKILQKQEICGNLLKLDFSMLIQDIAVHGTND